MCSPVLMIQVLYFQARLQRGNVHLKQAQLNEAKEDYKKVVRIICLMRENSNLPLTVCVCVSAHAHIWQTTSLFTQPIWHDSRQRTYCCVPVCYESVSFGLVHCTEVDIRLLPYFKKVLEVFTSGWHTHALATSHKHVVYHTLKFCCWNWKHCTLNAFFRIILNVRILTVHFTV